MNKIDDRLLALFAPPPAGFSEDKGDSVSHRNKLSKSELREIYLANRARENAELPLIKVHTRKCCTCGDWFESGGNRICKRCNSRADLGGMDTSPRGGLTSFSQISGYGLGGNA